MTGSAAVGTGFAASSSRTYPMWTFVSAWLVSVIAVCMFTFAALSARP